MAYFSCTAQASLQIAWQATGALEATLPFACNEDTHMTIRRIPAPMLYGLGTSIRWPRTLSSTTVEPAAAQCQAHWQQAGMRLESVRDAGSTCVAGSGDASLDDRLSAGLWLAARAVLSRSC
jgi:hypothetical protein